VLDYCVISACTRSNFSVLLCSSFFVCVCSCSFPEGPRLAVVAAQYRMPLAYRGFLGSYLLPFLQRAPTAVRVPGFQTGRTVGVTRAVLHFHFRNLSNREKKKANQFLPFTWKVKARRMRHFKASAMEVSAAALRQAVSRLLLWSSGQVDCRVGGINTIHCSQNCPSLREETLQRCNKKTNK
jgi:hypothetical protein